MKTKINEFAVVMALIIKKQTNIKINGLFFNNQGKYCYDFTLQKIRCITIILL